MYFISTVMLTEYCMDFLPFGGCYDPEFGFIRCQQNYKA
jgi:hypothetical protein